MVRAKQGDFKKRWSLPFELKIGDWYFRHRPEYSGRNAIALLSGGDQLFPSICEAVNAAKQEVWLATYIYVLDRSGQQVTNDLINAAQRGVKVRVVVDGFGSKESIKQLEAVFANTGVELVIFRPITGWRSWFQPDYLRRLHQKLCVVDGAIGFVGGINIIDDRHDLTHGQLDQPRLDFAVRLTGPEVEAIEQSIKAVWTRAMIGEAWTEELRKFTRASNPRQHAKRLMAAVRMPKPDQNAAPPSKVTEPPQPMEAAFLIRDNLKQRRTIENAYVAAILSAKESIDLVTPYFYPGKRFMNALKRAARRGVHIRLLMQGKWDYKTAALAARAMYSVLWKEGVQIYEYTPAFLHAKVARVDGTWATVGSSNMDPLSLLLNLEANVIVRDAEFVGTLKDRLEQAFALSTHMTPDHEQKNRWSRVQSRFIGWLARVYLRIAGARERF